MVGNSDALSLQPVSGGGREPPTAANTWRISAPLVPLIQAELIAVGAKALAGVPLSSWQMADHPRHTGLLLVPVLRTPSSSRNRAGASVMAGKAVYWPSASLVPA